MTDRKNGAAADESVSVEPFLSRLPFELTEGQSRSFRQIEQDLVSKRPMNRLVQGDVGSGKTVVAELAMYKMVKSGNESFYCDLILNAIPSPEGAYRTMD